MQTVEVQVTAVRQLLDNDDPTAVAEELLAGLRSIESTFTRVDLNTVTHREGRRVLRRYGYRRRMAH